MLPILDRSFRFTLVLAFLTLVFTSLWISKVSAASEAEPLRSKYTAVAVSDHVYVIHGPSGLPSPANQGFMNNPGFVLTSKGVVVIDPGSSVQTGRMVLEQIKTHTDAPVIASFASHIHGDHWLGNQAIREQYPDAVLYAHQNLIDAANAGGAETWIDLMLQLTGNATAGTMPVVPETAVADGDILDFGDIQISIHHKGKAHTTTDIALLVSGDNVLFTGDLVFNQRLGRMDDGQFIGLIRTLKHLISLKPSVVIPGHGKTAGLEIIDNMRELHKIIYATVETQFEQGLADFEMQQAVVEAAARFSHWEGFNDGIGKLISLSYLEVEEENF